MRVFIGVMLVIMCGLWLALTDAENRDRREAAKRAQMSAALEKITLQCLTGEGVTLAERAEACKLVSEVSK